MKEERLPQTELDLYLKSLGDSLAEHGRLHPQIQLFGLPVEEWAGPGYAVNLGIAASWTNTNWQGVKRKFAGLPNPAATSFYTDALGLSFAYSYYSAPSFVYPHNGRANVLFCDGHVESRTKEQIPTASADVFYSGNVATYTP